MRKCFPLAIFLLAASAWGQTQGILTADVKALTGGAPLDRTKMHVQLVGCAPNLPQIRGAVPPQVLSETAHDFTPAEMLSGQPYWGNDQVTCGGVTGETAWRVSIVRDRNTVWGPVDFQLTGAGPWDLGALDQVNNFTPTQFGGNATAWLGIPLDRTLPTIDNQTYCFNLAGRKWQLCTAGTGSQVNADWDALTGVAAILHKPTLPATLTCSGTDKVSGFNAATGAFTCGPDQLGTPGSGVASLNGATQTTQSFASGPNINVSTNTGTGVHTIGVTGLATVATSGSYNDLSSKPTIPAGPPYTEAQITNLTTDLAAKANTSSLATVATSGSYNDLSGKPTTWPWAGLTGVPSTFAPSAHNHAAGDVTSGTFAPSRIIPGTITNLRCVHIDSAGNLGLSDGDCGVASGGETDSYTPASGTKTIHGNLTLDGQFFPAGPFDVDSADPASDSPMGVSSAPERSRIGFDFDHKLKVSEGQGAVTEVAKVNSDITGMAAGISGTPAANQYYGTDPLGAKGFHDLPSGTLTWPQLAPDGTAAEPPYGFATEPGLGFYRPAAGIIALPTGKNLQFNRLLSSSANVPTSGCSECLGATDPIKAYFAASDQMCGATPCINLIAGAGDGTGRAKVGDHYGAIFPGPITLPADPANNLEAATKQYVDAHGGSMVYPGAGIAVSSGSGWGTSRTSPTGTIVGTTDTQTLTNKTVNGVTPTTFGYLDPTSSVQTQLNAKANSTDVAGSSLGLTKSGACASGYHADGTYNSDGTPHCSADTGGTGDTWVVAASTPSFSPAAGTYSSTQSVTASCAAGTVYCSTDGSTLAGSCSGMSVAASATLYARCEQAGKKPTNASAAYIIQEQVATPTYSPDGGSNLANDASVTISDGTTGAAIVYCTDTAGTCTPSTSYSSAVTVSAAGATTHLRSKATKSGMADSAVKDASYTYKVDAITASPAAGSYSGTQSVTLATTSTTGAYICYTTDGSTPAGTASSCTTGTHYTSAISVAASETIKAIGYKANYTASDTLTAAYTISGGSASAVKLGSAQAATSGTMSSSLSAAAATGTGIVVVVNQGYAAASATISLADNATGGSNTYTCDLGPFPAPDAAYTWICHAPVTHALTTSNTVTVTVSAYGNYAMGVYKLSSMSATPVDVYATNTNSYGTTQSTGTTGAATANDICIAAMQTGESGPVTAWSNSYTQLDDVVYSGYLEFAVGWKAISSGATTSTTMTWTSANSNTAGVQCYKQ